MDHLSSKVLRKNIQDQSCTCLPRGYRPAPTRIGNPWAGGCGSMLRLVETSNILSGDEDLK